MSNQIVIMSMEIETQSVWAVASVGPGFIAPYIRQHGHEASFLRVLPDMDMRDIICHIEKHAPDILGFSLTTRQWKRGAYVAGKIAKIIDIPIVAGGLHPTFLPSSVSESGAFDYICMGEGEAATLELLNCLESGEKIYEGRIPNIMLKRGAIPELRPPLGRIDDLPFMARDLLDEKHGVIHMCTQRGCPFPCTFCAAGAIDGLYKNTGYVRRRSVHNVLEELHEIRRNGELNYVIFLDDTFTINRNWVKEFCRAYAREFSTGFSINARAETINQDMIGWLADAGCSHIVYGVESGSMHIRRDVLNRPADNQCFIDVFKLTRQANILATANYMMGLPGETSEDIEETLSLNDEIAPDDFGYFVFYPYPGTKLFDICLQNGYLPDNYPEFPSDDSQSVLDMPGLSKADIKYYYNKFTRVHKSA